MEEGGKYNQRKKGHVKEETMDDTLGIVQIHPMKMIGFMLIS